MSILNKTLEELEKQEWGEPELSSHLVTECHRLRKIPLKDFSIENLRIVIGQGFSLKYLVPIALKKLHENPFAQGDYYAGDLLKAVLTLNSNFWKEEQELFYQLQDIMSEVEERVITVQSELFPVWQKQFSE